MDEIQVSIKQGEEFEVRLPSNPSTGYAWQVTVQPDGIRLLDSVFLAPEGEQPVAGAAGEQVFHFIADRPGRYELQMELKRRWERGLIDKRHVELTVY
jgi:inhibitor of cysteine peptidase